MEVSSPAKSALSSFVACPEWRSLGWEADVNATPVIYAFMEGKLPRYGLTKLLLGALSLLASACDQKADVQKEPTGTARVSVRPETTDQPVSNSFPTATSVRLFVESGEPGGTMQYSKPAGTLLSPEQRKKLESSLIITKAPEEMAACFIPHHFFRYYNAEGKQIGEIIICFCCNGVETEGASNISPTKGRMLSADYPRIKGLVRELGERTDIQCD